MIGVDPRDQLRYVLERIADHPVKHVDELLAWKVAGFHLNWISVTSPE